MESGAVEISPLLAKWLGGCVYHGGYETLLVQSKHLDHGRHTGTCSTVEGVYWAKCRWSLQFEELCVLKLGATSQKATGVARQVRSDAAYTQVH